MEEHERKTNIVRKTGSKGKLDELVDLLDGHTAILIRNLSTANEQNKGIRKSCLKAENHIKTFLAELVQKLFTRQDELLNELRAKTESTVDGVNETAESNYQKGKLLQKELGNMRKHVRIDEGQLNAMEEKVTSLAALTRSIEEAAPGLNVKFDLSAPISSIDTLGSITATPGDMGAMTEVRFS